MPVFTCYVDIVLPAMSMLIFPVVAMPVFTCDVDAWVYLLYQRSHPLPERISAAGR